MQLLLVIGIGWQLAVLSDSNDRIHAQDAKIADLREDAEPLLKAVAPLVREVRPVLRGADRLTGPLAETASDVSAVADMTPPVLRGARLLIGESLPLVDLLRLTLPEIRAALPELREALPEVRALIPRAHEGITSALELEALQREALRIQKDQHRIQKETLAVQLEALEHIESLDAKTGGDLTP